MVSEIQKRVKSTSSLNWPSILKFANDEEKKKISEFIAELCDGDIVISCHTYGIGYLCAEDSIIMHMDYRRYSKL
jgi:hypothetical protein